MVKYHEDTSIFQFNWNQVAEAFWQRYPNPFSKHVLSEDTISRKVKNGILHTARLITKTNRVPKWGEKLVPKRVVKIIEESTLDPKSKTFTTYTRNLGYTKLVSIVEKVVYKVCDENSNWTVAKRSAWVDSQTLGLSTALQVFALDRFKKNCKVMYIGFNYVLAQMYPQTAQYMKPTLAEMGFVYGLNETTGTKSTRIEDFQTSLHGKAEKVKDAAKKAKDLAKEKTGSIYAV